MYAPAVEQLIIIPNYEGLDTLRFEVGHSDEERGELSAVHFARFALPPDARTVLSDETKRSLLGDLA